jgi:uncharacterized membrane protein YkvI
MMQTLRKVLQIGLTYIGTVVGAGFASGQEILQFFTIYGLKGLWAIGLSTLFFLWIGTKMMLISREIGAYSYHDLNYYLFGKYVGTFANILTPLILFGVTTVMLAGTGSIFQEQLMLPYQMGILFTILLTYLIMTKGLNAILTVNSIIVPLLILFTVIISRNTFQFHGWFMPMEQSSSLNWLTVPFVYVSFNLAMAQAILVPLGKEINDDRVLRWGGFVGAIGLGLMLLGSSYALSSHMPNVMEYEIPMAMLLLGSGKTLHILFLIVIYGEIFTTLIANVYGLTRQFETCIRVPRSYLIAGILLLCYTVSLIGFSTLLQYLYPIFGYIGLGLFFMIAWKKGTNWKQV